MEPLNLTQKPPRKATDVLGGVIFMARTIDKVRASLPGGDLGAYKIDGFSTRVLKALEIDEDDLRSVVALARTEGDIEQWILRHTSEEARDRVNSELPALTLRDYVDRPGFFDRYPIAKEFPLDTPMLEMLNNDDLAMFADKH
jgi:hypothetical protein